MSFEESRLLSFEDLRRYDNRSGFYLVCAREVGLPVYRMFIDALTQVHKPIPPIEEYVLKSIQLGLTCEAEIAEFLGLELAIAQEAMVNLRMSEDIDLVAAEASAIQEWKLTKKGKKTLEEARILVPEERTFEIHYDALLRQPRWYGELGRYFITPQKLRNRNFEEIEPSVKKPPELSDLKLKEIDAIVREIETNKNRGPKNEQTRDLLALKALDRRQMCFQSATALVYKAKDSNTLQIGLVIDNRISTEHEAALARSRSFKKFQSKIQESIAQNESLKLAEELLGEEFVSQKSLDPESRTRTLTQKKALLSSQLEAIQDNLEKTSDDREKNELMQQIQEQNEQIAQLQSQIDQKLASMPIRWLQMYDHRPLLKKAVTESQERLMIISPWIRANSVNRSFLQEFENLLKRGVQVFIGYGLGEKDENRYPADIEAEKKLQKLAKQYSKSFIFKRLGDTHAKILISDSQFAAITSFNWLSFKGSRDRTFRDERGTLVCDPQKIEELFDDLKQRLMEASSSELSIGEKPLRKLNPRLNPKK